MLNNVMYKYPYKIQKFNLLAPIYACSATQCKIRDARFATQGLSSYFEITILILLGCFFILGILTGDIPHYQLKPQLVQESYSMLKTFEFT